MSIELPSFEQNVSHTNQHGTSLSRLFKKDPIAVTFVDVRLEQTIDGYRPDIIGTTDNGLEVIIEVYVTHKTSEEKVRRYRHRNLIEIDLSFAHQNEFNEEWLKTQVLTSVNSEWLNCDLHRDELEEAKSKLITEVEQLQGVINQGVLKREEEKQRKLQELHQRNLLEQQHLRVETERFNKYVQIKRKEMSFLINELQGFATPDIAAARNNFLQEQLDGSLFASEAPFLEMQGNLLFETHHYIWQDYLYQLYLDCDCCRYAMPYPKDVVAKFGFQYWMMNWIRLRDVQVDKYRVHFRSSYVEYGEPIAVGDEWFIPKGISFLTPAENSLITTPNDIVGRYYDHLDKHIKPEGGAKAGTKTDRTQLENRVFEESPYSRQNRILHSQQAEKVRGIIKAQIFNLINNNQHCTVKKCPNCSWYQEKHKEACEKCGSMAIFDCLLDKEYLRTLDSRLRCTPLRKELFI